jgi:hypothetical protein
MAIRSPLVRSNSGRASAWLDFVIVSLAPCSIRCEMFFHSAPRRKVARRGKRRDCAKVQEKYRWTFRSKVGICKRTPKDPTCRWRDRWATRPPTAVTGRWRPTEAPQTKAGESRAPRASCRATRRDCAKVWEKYWWTIWMGNGCAGRSRKAPPVSPAADEGWVPKPRSPVVKLTKGPGRRIWSARCARRQ